MNEFDSPGMGKGMKIGIAAIIFVLVTGMLAFFMVGQNPAGYRTVLQYPTGGLRVIFKQGPYLSAFGKTDMYSDFLTFDFQPKDNTCDFDQGDGIRVRYQDGGEGVVCGMARVNLPNDEAQMIAFHREYRSEEGARQKLLNQEFPKVLNLTAALMTSDESYATKRSEFIRMGRHQAVDGVYKTYLKIRMIPVGAPDANGEQEMQDREVPAILTNATTKQPLHEVAPFKAKGVIVSAFDLKGWDFEPKTLEQITKKRDANMKIITAKANAEKAYWEEQEVIAAGKKNEAQAEYQERLVAARELVKAELKVQKAEQRKLEAEQDFEAAKFEALAEIERKTGISKGKKLLIEADGALTQKLGAWNEAVKDISKGWANRDVSEVVIVMGGDSNGDAGSYNGSPQEVQVMLGMMLADMAKKQLGVDVEVVKK